MRLTWWGCAAIAIDAGERSIVIDPFVQPTDPRFQYVFHTHEHYDHLHLPTAEALAAGPRFERAIVARSCTLPSEFFYARRITHLPPERLTVLFPKVHERSRQRDFPGPSEITLDGWHVEGVESPGEEAGVAGPVEGEVPQLGFLIRHLESGITFYHPGDLGRPYPELGELRGRVDLMFLPLQKMGLDGDAVALDLIRPRHVVPTHYRYEPDYPIPKLYRDDEPLEQQILGHQFPGPDDPEAYIVALHRVAQPLGVRVVPLRAGVAFEL